MACPFNTFLCLAFLWHNHVFTARWCRVTVVEKKKKEIFVHPSTAKRKAQSVPKNVKCYRQPIVAVRLWSFSKRQPLFTSTSFIGTSGAHRNEEHEQRGKYIYIGVCIHAVLLLTQFTYSPLSKRGEGRLRGFKRERFRVCQELQVSHQQWCWRRW